MIRRLFFQLKTFQDEDIEAAEPKMTRSVARTLTESGDICPWIIHPKTPAKVLVFCRNFCLERLSF